MPSEYEPDMQPLHLFAKYYLNMKWYLSYPFIVIHTKGCHAFGYLNIGFNNATKELLIFK